MALVTAPEIEGLMVTGLKTADLTALIARQEDWLANDARVGIGPLTGERTIASRPRDLLADLKLTRAPDPESLVVRDNGVELAPEQWALVSAAILRRLDRPWSGPVIELDLTPTDTLAVKTAVIELVRLAVTDSPYRQESTEGHSYTRPAEVQRMREEIARGLSPHRGAASVYVGTPIGATS